VKYVLRYALKEKSNQQKSDATIILRNHIRSTKVEDIIREFKINESFRIYHRKDNVKLFHDVLSFAPENKGMITKEILRAIAEKYIELRAKNALCIIVHHSEKSHDHLHAILGGVKLDGYSSRISKQQFQHLKVEMEKFQQEKYPELSASVINHNGFTTQSKQQIIEAVTTIREPHKQSLLTILQNTFAIAQSREDFVHRLEQQNVQLYYRNNCLQGAVIEDRKFRFSKLGFNAEKFKTLDEREIEQYAVSELSDLRKGKSQHREKTKSGTSKPLVDDYEIKLLDELQALRKKGELNQSQERVIDIDGCDLPRVSGISDMKITEDSDGFEYNNDNLDEA
jgi:hypothetical protein